MGSCVRISAKTTKLLLLKWNFAPNCSLLGLPQLVIRKEKNPDFPITSMSRTTPEENFIDVLSSCPTVILLTVPLSICSSVSPSEKWKQQYLLHSAECGSKMIWRSSLYRNSSLALQSYVNALSGQAGCKDLDTVCVLDTGFGAWIESLALLFTRCMLLGKLPHLLLGLRFLICKQA